MFIHFSAGSATPHFQTIVPHSLPTSALTGRGSRKTIVHWLVRSFGRDLVNLSCDWNKRLLCYSFCCFLWQCKYWNLTHKQALACPFLLLCQRDMGKSQAVVDLSPYSHYLEELHHCCLELVRELANTKLWSSVSSEETVNRENGRQWTFCSHSPSHSFPGEIAALLAPERMTCWDSPTVPTSTAL